MLDKFYFDRKNNTDLNVYRCGIEDCAPGYSWGPALRDHYNIHYVFEGKGEFSINDTRYELSKGQGFLIPPDTVVSYKADSITPWSYCWVGFNGLKAESYISKAGLSKVTPVFKYDDTNALVSIIKNMLEVKEMKKGNELKLLSNLYMFLFLLTDSSGNVEIPAELSSRREEYLQAALDFISKNYSMPITIQEIAEQTGIDRSYLFLIFKEFLNISPREYLIKYRINVATELLKNNSLSIGDISRSVGYSDQLVFSKVFKKLTGESPLKYRHKI